MTHGAIITSVLAGAFVVAVAGASPAVAQSTLGGARTPQNKIGGAAKPPPVIGGATIHTTTPPNPPKPGPVVGMSKQGTTGGGTLTSGGNGTPATASLPSGPSKPNPPVTPPKTSNMVVSTSNLKCASGACVARKP